VTRAPARRDPAGLRAAEQGTALAGQASVRRIALLCLASSLAGCVVVPRLRQGHLNDPSMRAAGGVLEQRARRKLHTAREGAGGGDGEPAGGGCGCSN
jgi:hypothetical protein